MMEQKNNRNITEIGIRILILFVGLTIAHFGVTLFLLSDLGADPFNVLIQGIFRSLEAANGRSFLTHGNVHRIFCFLIILILLVVDRSYVKVGTLICMFCGGPIIDVFSTGITRLFGTVYVLPMKFGMLALGCVILAFGMTIVIKSDAGTGPNDLVAIVLSDKTNVRFGGMRIAVDVSFVVIGFLLGGTFGIGTLVCACMIGPVADFFLPKSEKLVQKILKRG